jgi:hypothetical protein
VRVREFELRLLAVALTVLWAAGGGIVLIAYRPGGPVDLLVGVAASSPLLVSVAAIIWPPLVRSDRGSAGVFWLGLIAGLLLLPSIAAVAGQVVQGGTEPLIPSLEVLYPWAIALLATCLFAGLGISRQLVPGIGIGRRRLAAAVAFTVVASTIIGGGFAGVSLADNAALANMPAAHSKFGPTNLKPDASGEVTLPSCTGIIVASGTANLEFDLSASVDSRAVGTVNLTGSRSGSDEAWTAQVVRSGARRVVGLGRVARVELEGRGPDGDRRADARSQRPCPCALAREPCHGRGSRPGICGRGAGAALPCLRRRCHLRGLVPASHMARRERRSGNVARRARLLDLRRR